MAGGKKVLKIRAQAKKFSFKYEGVGQPQGVVGKYYPAEDVVLKKGAAPVRNPPKLRATITPGTVLILLAGRFRGRRVVFLKQLESGLLLVTGPYAFNGVPLRRVNQRYVIATSTKVPLTGVRADGITDALFKRTKVAHVAGTKNIFATEEKEALSPERQKAQADVDAALTANVKKGDPLLQPYLSSKFSLKNGDKPHLLKF